MKNKLSFVILMFIGVFVNSQQVVINEKLLSQITVNHGVRLVSEQTF